MLTKTKSDILIATAQFHLDEMSSKEKDELIQKLYNKIYQAYEIVHALEKHNDHFAELGTVLRKALES